MFGLAAYAPDYAMLLVGANAGPIGMTKEHLAMIGSLGVPMIVVVTKIDYAPPEVLSETLQSIKKLVKAAGRGSLVIRNAEEICMVFGWESGVRNGSLVPLIQVSNVTGQGIDLLKLGLSLLVPRVIAAGPSSAVELAVNETYTVEGVGTVVSGTLLSGDLKVGQSLLLGPDERGEFQKTVVKGIHRRRTEVNAVHAVTSCSVALRKVIRSELRRGSMLLSPAQLSREDCAVCMEFEADVLILIHSTTITLKYQAVLHCGVIRQSVQIVEIIGREADSAVMRMGDRRRVRFKFIRHPEWIHLGQRLLFREGKTKGVGKIVALHPVKT